MTTAANDAFPKTRRALEFAATRPGRAAHAHEALLALARSERALQDGTDPALPQLADAVRTLVGNPWLQGNADDTDVIFLYALATPGVSLGPATLAEADEIISRVLWARFAD